MLKKAYTAKCGVPRSESPRSNRKGRSSVVMRTARRCPPGWWWVLGRVHWGQAVGRLGALGARAGLWAGQGQASKPAGGLEVGGWPTTLRAVGRASWARPAQPVAGAPTNSSAGRVGRGVEGGAGLVRGGGEGAPGGETVVASCCGCSCGGRGRPATRGRQEGRGACHAGKPGTGPKGLPVLLSCTGRRAAIWGHAGMHTPVFCNGGLVFRCPCAAAHARWERRAVGTRVARSRGARCPRPTPENGRRAASRRRRRARWRARGGGAEQVARAR
jgi:hypothetical protein